MHRVHKLASHLLQSPPAAMSRPPITSHVLDTGTGKPATDVKVTLDMKSISGWQEIGGDFTNVDGRCPKLLPVDYVLTPGLYRCTFDTASYYAKMGEKCFYPEVPIIFEIEATNEHYHIPLLINKFGYSTYRGS
mmetsp:Transcript_12542/g.18207  ORF Transcript_12542/g.18207 Transcript_12542/m.18207 type:complete len:134 (+) Transcript_12542:62-463(+)